MQGQAPDPTSDRLTTTHWSEEHISSCLTCLNFPIILDLLSIEILLARDAYRQHERPPSLLCLSNPQTHQGRLSLISTRQDTTGTALYSPPSP